MDSELGGTAQCVFENQETHMMFIDLHKACCTGHQVMDNDERNVHKS